MSYLFYNAKGNYDLSKWDTSSVTNMEGMFKNATKFNSPLTFDTSNVTNMSFMFFGATSFNQTLELLNISQVINARGMLANAKSFNRDMSTMSFSPTTDDSAMVAGTAITNVNWLPNTRNRLLYEAIISGDDSSIENYADSASLTLGSYLFASYNTKPSLLHSKTVLPTSFNVNINSWDVSNFTDMSFMFAHAEAFDQDLSSWDTTNVVDMSFMFYQAERFDQAVTFTMANVGNARAMFAGARNFNQDLSGLVLEDKVDDSAIVSGTAITESAYLPNTRNKALYSAILNNDADTIAHYDTSKLSLGSYLFANQGSFNADVSGWNVSHFDYMDSMFLYADTFDKTLEVGILAMLLI